MKFPLGELLETIGPLYTESNLGDLGMTEVGKSEAPVTLEVSVKDRHSSGFRVEGIVKTELTLPCDRCLGATTLHASAVIDVWVATEDQPEYDDDAIRLAPGENEISNSPLNSFCSLAAKLMLIG